MVDFNNLLRAFLIDLKALNIPQVDEMLKKHQIEVREQPLIEE